MRVGWIGLGRLGLPCAMAMASRGITVCGYDPHPQSVESLDYEAGLADLPMRGTFRQYSSVRQVVANSDIVLVAVQTPHEPRFDGTHLLDDDRADFETAYLANAVREVCREAEALKHRITMAVVSTVLPGTWDRIVAPYLNGYVHGAYTPSLIAMGTTVDDWLRPEMVICGTDDEWAFGAVERMHLQMHDRPIMRMRPIEAELTKQSYNTFIGLKIVFANSLMEICHHTGADVDAVTGALAQASDRIISPKYLAGGMGDGGGCHPRDNLAISWLSQRLGLSVDVAGFAMQAREAQSWWLADLVEHWRRMSGLDVALCGTEYKANVPLTVGSAALLLERMLDGCQTVSVHQDLPESPHVFVVTTNHDRWRDETWPAGSVILDPWGMIADQPGCTVIRIGRR